MKVHQIKSRCVVSLDKILEYQIWFHCFNADLQLNRSEQLCLITLAKNPKILLSEFCIIMTEDIPEEIRFKNAQTVRNLILKLTDLKLVIKSGSSRRIKLALGIPNVEYKDSIVLTTSILHKNEN